MFQTLYESPWLNTALLGAAGFLVIAAWIQRRSFLTAFMVLFSFEILADAYHAGSWSPTLHWHWDDRFSLMFIMLGDLRYFLLNERFAFRPDSQPFDATTRQAWMRTVALTFICPIISFASRAFPEGTDPHWTYLLWEVPFVLLALVLRFRVYPRRLAAAPPAVRKWLLDLGTFELVMYGLWVVSDVLILSTGADVGFALRIVPNFLYYVVFMGLVGFRAPAEVDG